MALAIRYHLLRAASRRKASGGAAETVRNRPEHRASHEPTSDMPPSGLTGSRAARAYFSSRVATALPC
jgi:hypothetical protein